MRKNLSLVQHFMLIMVLLSAQLSSAFAIAPMQMECSMDMTEHAMMMSETGEGSHKLEPDEMDCCDPSSTVPCCGENCHCGDAAGIQTVLESGVTQQVVSKHGSKYVDYSSQYTSLYLSQKSPPPIS